MAGAAGVNPEVIQRGVTTRYHTMTQEGIESTIFKYEYRRDIHEMSGGITIEEGKDKREGL